MSHTPYNDAGKFDKTQESFNAIHHALIALAQPNISAEDREKAISSAIKGVSNLGLQIVGTLKEMDRRLHALENQGR